MLYGINVLMCTQDGGGIAGNVCTRWRWYYRKCVHKMAVVLQEMCTQDSGVITGNVYTRWVVVQEMGTQDGGGITGNFQNYRCLIIF